MTRTDSRQIIEPDADGFMVIADPRSRFNGMRCCDYIDCAVKPWTNERNRMRKEDRDRAEKEGVGTSLRINLRPPIPPWPVCVPKPKAAPKVDEL